MTTAPDRLHSTGDRLTYEMRIPMNDIARVANLYGWCLLADTFEEGSPTQEHVMRVALITQAINEADIPEDVRDDLRATATLMPKVARQALGGWVRDVIAYQDDLSVGRAA